MQHGYLDTIVCLSVQGFSQTCSEGFFFFFLLPSRFHLALHCRNLACKYSCVPGILVTYRLSEYCRHHPGLFVPAYWVSAYVLQIALVVEGGSLCVF